MIYRRKMLLEQVAHWERMNKEEKVMINNNEEYRGDGQENR